MGGPDGFRGSPAHTHLVSTGRTLRPTPKAQRPEMRGPKNRCPPTLPIPRAALTSWPPGEPCGHRTARAALPGPQAGRPASPPDILSDALRDSVQGTGTGSCAVEGHPCREQHPGAQQGLWNIPGSHRSPPSAPHLHSGSESSALAHLDTLLSPLGGWRTTLSSRNLDNPGEPVEATTWDLPGPAPRPGSAKGPPQSRRHAPPHSPAQTSP